MVKLSKISKRILIPALLLVIAAVIASALFFLKDKNQSDSALKNSKASLSVPSDNCASRPTYTCYKTELTNIVDKQNPETATALVKQQYAKIPYVKSQCHQLMHAIGRASTIRYNNLGNTYVHGDHFCASGYFHGASEEVIAQKGTSYIVKNSSQICKVFAEKRRYALDHYNCVHGLGHGFMEAQEGDLFASLKACDSLSDTWEQRSCYSGVFMQNIMFAESPDETADHSSKFLRKDDPMYPCNSVDDKYKTGCYIIQTSWALPQVNNDFGKVFVMCSQVSEAFRYICYQSLGRDASGLQGYNTEVTINTCMLGSTLDAKNNCMIGAAKDFVYNYHSDKQATSLCDKLSEDLKTGCQSAVDEYFKSFST
jgi:hypothetical protein